MRRLAFVLISILAAGCDRPKDRAGCSAASDCPSGQTCAHTADGNVCWPDAVAPVVGPVAVTCDAEPCRRDGTLTVSATVTDDRDVGEVVASLDLDGHAKTVAMARAGAGGTYRALVPLAGWPFPAFERTVLARVTARDGARNEAALEAASGVGVTRVRWSYDAAAPLGAPAVMADGTIVVGRAAATDQVLAVHPDGTKAWSASVGSFVTQAPSIGASAIWVAAGNRVFALKLDGSAVLNGAGCDTGGAVIGPPAVSDSPAPDVAFAASSAARVWAVAPSGVYGCVAPTAASTPFPPFTAGPVLNGRSDLFAVSDAGGSAAATLRIFTFDGLAFSQVTAAPELGQVVNGPLSIDSLGNVWSGSSDLSASALHGTTSAGVPTWTVPLSSSASSSTAILQGDAVAVCLDDNTLRLFSPAGTALWPTAPQLSGVGLTPIVLAGGDATFLVPTKAGTIHAIAADGRVLWSGTLASNQELREGNVFTAPGAALGTAYFTSADGKLHAVIVDGHLDAAAPWPKAWHDARNTSNAATAD